MKVLNSLLFQGVLCNNPVKLRKRQNFITLKGEAPQEQPSNSPVHYDMEIP